MVIVGRKLLNFPTILKSINISDLTNVITKL